MALLDFFLSRKKNTANIAKERLQIIVAERRRGDAEPHYLPQLRKDILEVICKYVQIDPEMVSVQLEQRDGDISILELNVRVEILTCRAIAKKNRLRHAPPVF